MLVYLIILILKEIKYSNIKKKLKCTKTNLRKKEDKYYFDISFNALHHTYISYLT